MSPSSPPPHEALRTWLRQRVGAAVATRLRLVEGLVGDLPTARQEVAQLAEGAGRLSRQLEALEARLEARAFDADMTMAQVLDRHGGATAVLTRHDLPACSDCAVRFDETLGEAAQAYGLPLASLLAELNALLPPTESLA